MRRALVAVFTALVVLASVPTAGVLAGTDEPEPPRITVNEFMPQERSLSDCLSVLPKPGCGSEARGGPAQAAVFGAILLGLGVIGTRIVVGVRRRGPSDPDPTAEAAPRQPQP